MKKTFFKNLFRDIKKTISRFLSIVVIITIGVAFYAGVRATSPDMKMSGDYYFNKNNLMDFKVISTLGLTKDDISVIQKQNGISNVQGSYSVDAVTEINKHQIVLNINSLPDEGGINGIRIVRGRMPQKADEAVVEEKFFKKNNLKLNDNIVLKSGSDSSLQDDLKNTGFKIVGTAESPLYASEQRQLSSVGNGSVKGFIYILPEVFKSDVYTEIYVKADNNESKNSLADNESYKGSIKKTEDALKALGPSRNEIRYAEVLKTANDKINDAKEKLESSKKEAEEKFAEGHNKINAAKDNIVKGWNEFKQNEAIFNQKMKDGQKQIDDGKNQIASAESTISAKEQEIQNAKIQLDATIKQLGESSANSSDGNQQSDEQISRERLKIAETEKEIQYGETEISNGKAEIEANKNKISDAEVKLNKAREEGTAKLQGAKKELEDGESQITVNEEKLKSEEESAELKFKDAEAEIQKNENKINDIKKPEWYVLGRSQNVGYEAYRQDSGRVDNIGKAFPLIFFLVASLVSLTTMTRMVQEKRTEAGTFNAIGYSDASIVCHYLIYSLLASIMGSILGVLIGFRLFPSFIMNAYGSIYTIPYMLTPFNTGIALQSSLIAILFTCTASVAAVLSELRESPASLMRPKAPKVGNRIWLENIHFIWKKLNFTRKVTARNIFRYKQRLFMTIVGIAACTGLMITGFGLKEAITGATKTQFDSIYKFDMQGTLNKNLNENDKNDMKQKALNDLNIKSVLFAYSKNGTAYEGKSESQDVYIVVPEDKSLISNYINLTMNGRKLKLGDDGVIITEKLSEILNKKAGDSIEININDKIIKVKISAVTEHYIQHYVYMSPDYYKKLTGDNITFNSFYGLLKNKSETNENSTLSALKSISGVSSVTFKNNIRVDYNKSVNSVNAVVVILTVSAGILAFVVIYNLTNINISERRRELATIKLLGFYDNELAAYIYRENTILTIIGSIIGIPAGIVINKLVIATAETNGLMFLHKISPVYFAYSVLLTILFSVAVNITMYKKFDKIDMIESLKNPE